MRYFTIAFLIGVCTLTLFSKVPTSVFIEITFFILICNVGFLLLVDKDLKPLSWSILFGCAFLFGFSAALFRAHAIAEINLPLNYQNKTILVQGTISSIPDVQQYNSAFEFDITRAIVNSHGQPFVMRVRLSFMGQSPSPLKVGDEWQFQVRLKPPHGLSNPGSFDYERWLFEHRLRATGYVRISPDNKLLASHITVHPIDRLRQMLASRIALTLQADPMKGFITALAVGVRNDITASQWQVLRATGTNHLMAIAGLHIGLLAAMVSVVVAGLWRRSTRLLLFLPAQHAAAIAALLSAIFYSALAGFALPTQRAVIMLTVFLAAVILRRLLLPWQGLLIALLIILILDPLAPLSDSFWLSFAAVAAIIYGVSARLGSNTGWKQLWEKWGRVQWLIAVGLIPASLLFFHQVSLSGVIANSLAIPWVGFVVLPITLIGTILLLIVPFLGMLFIKLANQLLALFWPVMEFISKISWLQWHAEINNAWILAASVIGILLLLAPRGMPARWVGGVWLLPLFFWKPAVPHSGDAWFTLLDVGQGLAAIVQTKNHILVYDTGARFNDEFNMGEAVVVPYLRNRGVNKIDTLIISHGDNDHSGGVNSVVRDIPTKMILTSQPQRFASLGASACLQGQSWQWDGVKFQFIYPPSELLGLNNDSSCVLRISVGKHAILLPGDIERKSERYLVTTLPQLLPADIIAAPHHGSRTSSTPDFVKTVNPKYVVFGVGYYNRYHFPHPMVLQHYNDQGTRAYDSVHDGAITFKITANNPITPPESYRLMNHHFWNQS
jgi:competence protein ComEC